jgi:hypothetical protein
MTEAKNIGEYLNELGERFDHLCIERHKVGAEEYGELTFLGNDVMRMMLEELADTVNYCRMQSIKLLLLQEQLEDGLAGLDTDEGQITLGIQAFKGVGEIGWDKQ